MNKVCPLPFYHLSLSPSGGIHGCCVSSSLGHLKDQWPEQLWTSKKLNEFRKSHLKGELPDSCSSCRDSESRGEASYREKVRSMLTRTQLNDYISLSEPDTGLTKTPIRYLEIKLSNLCNLMCRMCSPEFSSKWASYLNTAEKPETRRRLIEDFPGVLDSISKTINDPSFETLCFAGGEPFLDPDHFTVLDQLKHPDSVSYVVNTNLTSLEFSGGQILERLDEFNEVHLIVSIDGDKNTQKYIRSFLPVEKFEQNLFKLRGFSEKRHWKTYSAATISALNIHKVPELIEYSLEKDLIPREFTLLDSPLHLSADILPKNTRLEIAERVSSWFENFDIDAFIQKYELNQVAEYKTTSIKNLESSIHSLTTLLKRPEKPLHASQRKKLWDQTVELDKIAKTDIFRIDPDFQDRLFNEENNQ